MEHCDVVLVFAFGAPGTTAPNQYLAKEASGWAHFKGAPLVAQSEFGFLPGRGICVIEGHNLSSLDLALRFSKIAEGRGWRQVDLFAAPLVAHRCARDLEESGFYVKVHIPEKNTRSFWYDRSSEAIWTRRHTFGWIREQLLRLIPWTLYRYITKE